jgi:hypothetical protein
MIAAAVPHVALALALALAFTLTPDARASERKPGAKVAPADAR